MSKRLILLGALVVGAAALVAYQPGFKVGFFNGWWYLEWVGSMDLPRYLIQFLDPRNVTQGYRPVQGLYVLIQYWLFHYNSDGYLLTHALLHAANSILLFCIVGRLSGRWRVAVVAACVYAVSPVYSLAVFWHAVVDPLSAFFYLLTIFLWTVYQETRRPLHWAATFAAYLFALFSKETAVFLPVLLFLIERWFYHRRPDLRTLARQYLAFLVVFVPYGLLELNVHSHGEFVGQFKFSLGPHMLGNLMPYLAVLTFPWTTDLPRDPAVYLWLAIVVVLYVGWMIYKRSTTLLFLGIVAVANIAPLLGFPLDFFNTRYLYTSLMASAVVFAMVVEAGWRALGPRRLAAVVASGLLAVVVVVSGARVAEAAAGLAEYTRQLRVPFRDIARAHPTLADDTLLYFVDSPNTPLTEFEGMSFVRYGPSVHVDGSGTGHRPALREHNAALVYYFDASGRPVELPVDKQANTHSSIALPAAMSVPIVLDDYQVPSATLEQGKAAVLFLSWSAQAQIDKDYSLFVHLVDRNGKQVAGYDGTPGHGDLPTSGWRRGPPISDVIVLPIPSDVPAGDSYRLEVGFYDPATLQRLTFTGANGQGSGDVVVIEPFAVAGTRSP